MNILLIGTIVKDVIHHYDGSTSRSLGGLMYSIQAVLPLLQEGDVLTPLTYVGEDIYDQVLDRYSGNKQIRTSGFLLKKQPNNTVELTYRDPQERQERSLHPFPELPFSLIEPFLWADLLLLNLISGWEVSVNTFTRIRQAFPGRISLDLHSLVLGRRANGLRFLQPFENIGPWITNSDVVQANESEFEMLGTHSGNPEDFFDKICFKEDKIFNLTRASRGSRSFFMRNGALRQWDQKPPAGLEVLDPTGCGDAFMAGFALEYQRSGELAKAAEAANYLAALTGTFKGLPPLWEMKRRLRGNI